MATVLTLNNRSRILFERGQFSMQGEPTEAALKVFAEKLAAYLGQKPDFKINPMPFEEKISKQVHKIATLDFSSERKTMSTVVIGYDGSL